MRRLAVLACLSIAGFALSDIGHASADAGDRAPIVEYSWIDANEGGAAGGHVALRIDDEVHHFHLETGGVLRLYREDVAGFERLYTRRRNRTIRSARLDVTPQTRDLLRAGFEGYFEAQEAAAARISAAREDAAWIERLAEIAAANANPRADSSAEDAGLALEGLGFFYADGAEPLLAAPPGDSGAQAIREVAARVAQRAGPDAIATRARAIRSEILALAPDADAPAATAERVHARSFARRHGDRLVTLAALDVLTHAPALRTDALRDSAAPELALSETDRRALATQRELLVERSARAALGDDAEQGFALIVALARLGAIDGSLARDRLLVLDAFAPRHDLLSRGALAENRDELQALRAATRAELDAARAAFRASPSGASTPARGSNDDLASHETSFERLESAVNRWIEAEEAATGRRDLRVNSGPLVPSRSATRTGLSLPARSAATLRADAARARTQADSDARAFRSAYEYSLLTRNCVTEIFRIIDASLIGSTSRFLSPAERARAEDAARERLGGFVDAGSGLHYIPHRAYAAVLESWRIASTREVPSWRRQQIEALEHAGAGTAGERSVPTSSVYRSNDEDSLFLFFTDDAFVARPLYGLANLLVGFGGSLAGVFSAPFDGGRLLDRSTRGIVFSLPELAFSNIRKGSFEGGSTDEAAGPGTRSLGETSLESNPEAR